MKKYEIRVIPNSDSEGETYWTAFYPAVDGCVGGGATVDEAVKEAEENLEIFLNYLSSKKSELPKEYEELACNGKISLRVSKTVHQKLIYLATEEGVSINALLNNAISTYIGKSEYNYELNKKIEALQDVAEKSYKLQCVNAMYNEATAKALWSKPVRINVGEDL